MAETARWRGSIGIGLALLVTSGLASADEFDTASVRFEQNATDGDVEVVFEVKGGDAGLTSLSIVGPDGRTVASFQAPDESTLGIRQFEFESPEPPDTAVLKAAYPEGAYRFSASTAGGDEFQGESRLSHALPATGAFTRPEEDAPQSTDLTVEWTPVPGIAGYIVEIEHDELEVGITAQLAADTTTFSVPPGFLLPGMEYELALGTLGDDGNISFVETSFETAEKE